VNALLGTVAALLPLAISLVSFVQLLYMDALRLRGRGGPAHEYFKETFQPKLRLDPEEGALVFSLIKQALIVLESMAMFGAFQLGQDLLWSIALEAVALTIGIVIVSVYVLPQALYQKTNAHWLSVLIPVLKVIALPARPLVWAFRLLESLAGLGGPEEAPAANGSATQEIEALIEAGADEGLIEENDRKLLQSVVALGNKSVSEVMSPRGDIVAIRHDASLEQLRALAGEQGYSRIPVYKDSIDNIIGFVHVRDIFKYGQKDGGATRVLEFLRPIRSVPETQRADEVFREMQQDNAHIAVVVDEYGNTAGLVTMEDVVEEVFGEIQDEHDQAGDIRKESDGVWILSGNVDLDLLNELVQFRPTQETESTTVGGLVTEWLGRVPRAGEAVERDGIRIEATAADERRVEAVRISRTTPPEAPVRDREGAATTEVRAESGG
jgi:CBS domain containing-hemolysin-like protein